MSTIRRAVAFLSDPTAGGSSYDALTSGAIPDCTDVWPVTGVTRNKNVSVLERPDLISGLRGDLPPESFRQDPRYTLRGRAYPRQLKQLVAMVTGVADTKTGTPPAAITHAFTPAGYGAIALPAKYMQLEQDGLNEKASGVVCNQLSMTFANDGDGTWEADLWALYRNQFGSPPALVAAPADLSNTTYKLRDLKAYFAGSGSQVPDVVSASFVFANNIIDDNEVRFQAGKNIAAQLDAGANKHYVWYPSEHRIGADMAISGSIGFSAVEIAEDLKHDLAVAEKLVFEVDAGDLTTTPAATQRMRITVYNKVYSDFTVDDLAKSGAAKSSLNFKGYLDPATASSIKIEFVDASNVLIAV